MPVIYTIQGYKIYFWSNENGEPIHVHIAKGQPTGNATKVWITRGGDLILAHNKSRIPKKDLNGLFYYLRKNVSFIVSMWVNRFDYERYIV